MAKYCSSCDLPEWTCSCSHTITFGTDTDVHEIKTWDGEVVYTSTTSTTLEGTMKFEDGKVMVYVGGKWVPMVMPSEADGPDEEVPEIDDDDALKIAEGRRLTMIIEDTCGSRLKPDKIREIVDAIQAEGFRQD